MKEIYGNSKSKKSKEVPDDPLPGRYVVQRALSNDQYTTADEAIDVVTEAMLACKSKYRQDLGLAPTIYKLNPAIVTEVDRAKLRSRQLRLYKSMLAGKFADNTKQNSNLKEWVAVQQGFEDNDYSNDFGLQEVHSLTNLLTSLFTGLLTHSLAYSLTQLLTHSQTYSLTGSTPTHSLTGTHSFPHITSSFLRQ